MRRHTLAPVSTAEDQQRVLRSRRLVDPAVVTGLLRGAGPWSVRHVEVTGSTNADLAADARTLPHGTVLTAEEQLTGRGRSGRDWSCPRGAGLMFSVLLREPRIPPERRGWTGAVLGLAIVRALATVSGVTATLKWPNDVLIDGHKCAGILGEVADDAVVIGSGINITLRTGELPRPDATSLLLAAAAATDEQLDREVLLARILDEFSRLLRRWSAAGGDIEASGLRADYKDVCATVGARVRLDLPGGGSAQVLAVDVAADGSLVVQDDAGVRRSYSAADVVHLRPGR